jgi:DNA (cytosine-5)-methyltransferase 3A
MSRALGVYPVRINSKLVTAQLRDRYYWSNIKTKETMFDIVTDIPQPKDKGIMFKDIITGGRVERVKALALLESESRAVTNQESIKKRASREFINMIYVDTDKHVALKTWNGDGSKQEYLKHRNETTGMLTLIQENKIVRTVNKIEMCRLQGFPDNYCDILTTAKAGSLLGDGWTLPIIEHIFNFIER